MMTSKKAHLTSTFDVDRLKDKYLALNSTQDSIQTLSLWVLHHKAHCEKIVEVWLKIFKKSKSRQKLNLFYLANDVIQNSKKRNARIFITVFKRALIEAVYNIKNDNIKPQVSRILNILRDRKFYDKVFINELLEAIGEDKGDSTVPSLKISSTKNVQGKGGLNKPNENGNGSETYKPNDLFLELNKMEKLTNDMRNKESEVEKCLSHFDLNSKEWVKNYKDKVSGQRLDTNLENCSLKLESFIPFLEKLIRDRNTLIKNVQKAIEHYATIYEDAKFVTMAYKKYGSRVRNVQQKVKSNRDQILPKLLKQAETPEITLQPDPESVGQGGIDALEAQKLFQDLSKLVGSFGQGGALSPTQKSDFPAAKLSPSRDTDLRKAFEATNGDVDLRYSSPPPQRDSAQIADMELGYDEEDMNGSTALDNRIDSLFVKQDVDARAASLNDEEFQGSNSQTISAPPDTSSSPLFLLPPPPPPPLLPLAPSNFALAQQIEEPQADPKPLDILTRLIGLNKSNVPQPKQSLQNFQTYQANNDNDDSYKAESESYIQTASSNPNPSSYYPTQPVVYRASSLKTQYQLGDEDYSMSPPPFDYYGEDRNKGGDGNSYTYPQDPYNGRSQIYGQTMIPLDPGSNYNSQESPYMQGSQMPLSLGSNQDYNPTNYSSYPQNYRNSSQGSDVDTRGNPNLLVVVGNNAQPGARHMDYNKKY